MIFEWDDKKESANIKKHEIDFELAQEAFFDKKRIIFHDEKHSSDEERWFCVGKAGKKIITVRFTYRNNKIRIIGAGEWRKGKAIYEQENKN